MQAVIASVVKNPLTPTKELAALACAYERLEERKRVLRGTPLPGSFRPVSKRKKSPSHLDVQDPTKG